MVRRHFLQGIAASSGAVLGVGGANRRADDRTTAQMHVRGFYCPTCAVGLETVLGRQEGIINAKATYPEGRLTVGYHAALITRNRIEEIIRGCQFEVKD